MSKVMQEHHLVVYQEEMDYVERLEWLMSGAYEGKWRFDKKLRKLVIKTEENQECYFFFKYHKGINPYETGLMGTRYSGVMFLAGEYDNTFINCCLIRCRGARWEVDEI